MTLRDGDVMSGGISDMFPSSQWRSEVHLRSLRSAPKTLRITARPPREDASAERTTFTSVATSNVAGVAAVASNNRPAGRGGLEFVTDRQGLQTIASFNLPSEHLIYDVSWRGEVLLTAMSDGAVGMFKVDAAKLAKTTGSTQPSGQYTETFMHPQLNIKSAPPPPPGRWHYSTRVNRIVVNPHDTSLFLTLENHRFHLWHTELSNGPTLTEQGSTAPLFSCDWSPHSPNDIVISGLSRSIKIMDTRLLKDRMNENSSWKAEGAHEGAVQDVKWSPFVPHWLATCGDDGAIKVWDIRMNRQLSSGTMVGSGNHIPAATIEAHGGAVKRVNWCPTHAELLASGGADRLMNLWSLRLEPHYRMWTCDKFSDSVIGSSFMHTNIPQCVCVSGSSETLIVTLTEQFLSGLVPHRLDTEDERAIETALYLRDFPQAFDKIASVASEYQSSGAPNAGGSGSASVKKAAALLDLCSAFPIKESSRETFQEQLENFAYRIPPNFPFSSLAYPVPNSVLQKLNLLRLNIKLSRCIAAQDHTELSRIVRTDAFKRLEQVLDTSVMVRVIQTILPNHYLVALDTIIRYGEGLNRPSSGSVSGTDQKPDTTESKWNTFASLARMVLSPTIFDADQAALEKQLKNPHVVIPELQLLRHVTSATSHPEPAARIIDMVSRRRNIPLSEAVTRLYMNSLLDKRQFHTFFVKASDIVMNVRTGSMASALQEMLSKSGLSLLKVHVKEYRDALLKAPADPSGVVDCLQMIVEILITVTTLSSVVQDTMLGMVRALKSDIEGSLHELCGSQGTAEGKVIASKVLNQIQELRDRKKVHSINQNTADLLDAVTVMLQQFV